MCYYEQQKSHTGVLSIIVEFLWQFYILIAEDISAHISTYQVQMNSLPDRIIIQSLFRFILYFCLSKLIF